MGVNNFIDHYSVLGLPTGENGLNVSTGDIKKAFRSKALELHPDKQPNNPNAVRNFQNLQASYEILKDENARKDFDYDYMIRLKEEIKVKRTVFDVSRCEKRCREEEAAAEHSEKKVRREETVYRNICSIREIYAKKSAYDLFYSVLTLRKGHIYVDDDGCAKKSSNDLFY